MTKIILLITALLLTAPVAVLAAKPSPASLRALAQKCVEAQRRAPGIVIGVIDRNGKSVVAYGHLDEAGSPEVDGDTLFEIGSITKVFTGLILEDMVEHGEVQLDDPVAKYLPASVTVPSRNGKQITLRQLATHRSGLPRLPDNLDPADDENPYADYTVPQLYDFLSGYKLKRNPGAKEEYSNLGMGLLGHALSLRAGTNYEALVIHRICTPLNMDSTRVTLNPALKARFATPHNESGSAVKPWDIPALAGCGALRSSANDLLKLLAAEMGLAPTPLSKEMNATQAAQPGTGWMNKVGLAWQIDAVGDIVWHNGGTGGFRSYMGFLMDKSLGVVVLVNSENDVDDIGQFLLGDQDDIQNFHAPKKHVEVKIDPSVYDQYVGQYKLGFGAEFIITRQGDRLMAKLGEQNTYQVFPESKTDFFYKVVDAQLTFVANAQGEITHLVLHQNGRDQKAKKVQ